MNNDQLQVDRCLLSTGAKRLEAGQLHFSEIWASFSSNVEHALF